MNISSRLPVDENKTTIYFSVIIIAGGRGARLGGIDKPAIDVGGQSMRSRVINAARGALGDFVPVVVVGEWGADLEAFGPNGDGAEAGAVAVVREEPPFSGPVAGLERGLREVADSERVIVLGGDMPRLSSRLIRELANAPEQPGSGPGPRESKARILEAREPGRDAKNEAWTLRDSSGHPQFLFGSWPVALLRRCLDLISDPERGWDGVSLKRLYRAIGEVGGELRFMESESSTAMHEIQDVDDPVELAAVRAEYGEAAEDGDNRGDDAPPSEGHL